jgi:hypothetical protein
MTRQSRRRLPLSSLDNNRTSRRSKRLKTVADSDSSSDEDEVLEGVEKATRTLEAETASEAVGASGMAGNDGATGDAAASTDEVEEGLNETEEGAADNEAADEIPANMNLRCMKAIDLHFPKQRRKGKMQPTPPFQMDVFLLSEWRCMTQEEQRAAKAEFTSKGAAEKKRLKLLVPGADCLCCKRKARTDRGQARGQNPRQRRSARVAGKAGPPAPPNPPAVPPPIQTVEAYIGLGSSEAERNNMLPAEKGYYKRTSIRKLQHARSVQGQGGVQALKAIHSANKAFARALTISTVAPKLDVATNTLVYANPARAPRVLALQVFINQVEETPMSGGTLSGSQLRREKAQITYISSSKEDAERIFEILAVDSRINGEKYDKKKFFGTGARLIQKLKAGEAERGRRRSRPSAANLQESSNEIPHSIAPTSQGI